MNCPVCGAERSERSHGENLAVIDCQSCQRLPLWWVGLLAAGGVVKSAPAHAGSLLQAAAGGTMRAGGYLAAQFPGGFRPVRWGVERTKR